MKKLLYLASAMLLFSACSQKGYEIKGVVSDNNLNGKYIYLQKYGMKDAKPIDSVLVKNNAFVFKGVKEAPELVTLCFSPDVVKKGRPADMGLPMPYTITFVLDNNDFDANIQEMSTIYGTPEVDAYMKVQQYLKDFVAKADALEADLKSEDKAVVEKAEKEYDALVEAKNKFVLKYITDNIDKLSAAKIFYDYRYDLEEKFQHDVIAKAGDVFKSAPNIDKLIKHLKVLETVAIGKQYKDFELPDANGKMHKLSDYVGKNEVVLIDFWASWCPPCRAELPNLVNVYDKYHKKGFEIVGVSMDSNKADWEKAISNFKMTWPQMSELKGWESTAGALYGVNSIPHTVLIDKNGKIIAKNLHGKEVEEAVAKALKK